jgi:hypothetical protein
MGLVLSDRAVLDTWTIDFLLIVTPPVDLWEQ